MTDSSFIRLPPGLFITATGTGAGKTFVARGLAAALRERGLRVAALKPVETGVPAPQTMEPAARATAVDAAPPDAAAAPPPTDAALLARAAGRPELAHAPGFYRAALPAAPYAIALATGAPPPDLDALARAIAHAAAGADVALIEGAGGLLVPIDRERTFAELAQRLALPLVLVAPNALGVLSHALTAAECAARRDLTLAALVLTDIAPPDDARDPSRAHNAAILAERLRCPVLRMPFCAEPTDAALAEAARAAGLAQLL